MSYKFLDALTKRGISVRLEIGVTPDEDNLVLTPKEKVTDGIRETVQSNHKAILAEYSDWLKEETRRATDRINKTGFAFIRCSLLAGDVVIIARDEATRDRCRRFGKPIYTLAELARLRHLAPGHLRMVHKVKATFGGKVAEVFDPRPDLEDDAIEWGNLLERAKDSPLYGPLHGFRCFGTRLERRGVGWALVYNPSRDGWKDQAEFEAHYSLWLRGSEIELRRLLGLITVARPPREAVQGAMLEGATV